MTWLAVSLSPFGAGQRRGIDPDRDREARLVDDRDRQRPWIVGVGDRLADRHLGEAGEGDDLAGAGLVGRDPVERLGDQELGHPCVLDLAVRPAPGDLLALPEDPVADPQQREAADVGRGVEVRDERLQRMVRVVRRCWNRLEQRLEERSQVVVERGGVEPRFPLSGNRVDDRELDLLRGRVEVEEELVHLVHDLFDPCVGAVDLVHDEHDRQPRLECLAQDEARLRQRSFGGVDEQEHAVDHRQAALDLAAEVRMPRRVDDVDLRAVQPDRGVLGEDGDPLLALEVAGVHDALGDILVLAERAGLPEHRVDEGRLAVVDVGDDGDVPQIVAMGEGLRHGPAG